MIIQAFFGEAQTGLGYQFYDESGALLGTRVTTGIVSLPEAGGYAADATAPAGFVGVFWDSAETPDGTSEALTSSAPTAIEIADEIASRADQILLATAYVPSPGPSLVIPAPSGDVTTCRVYLYAIGIDGLPRKGVEIKFTLVNVPTKNESLFHVRETLSVVTDAAGYAEIDLERTDGMTPAGSVYLVRSRELGMDDVEMTLAADVYDLGSLIT